ncbi:MAG: hypothetical protein ACYS0H_26760 [Planctomycetota bacterium]|jgi:hypothetical protein
MFRLLIPISLLILVIPVCAELDPKSSGPVGEPAEHTLHRRFSTTYALGCLRKIASGLSSFDELTRESKTLISRERLKEIGNTDWETQNLGFPNALGAVEGTLRRQECLIKKRSYELALERAKTGKPDKKQLAKARKEKEQAEKSYRKFLDSFSIVD